MKKTIKRIIFFQVCFWQRQHVTLSSALTSTSRWSKARAHQITPAQRDQNNRGLAAATSACPHGPTCRRNGLKSSKIREACEALENKPHNHSGIDQAIIITYILLTAWHRNRNERAWLVVPSVPSADWKLHTHTLLRRSKNGSVQYKIICPETNAHQSD